MRVRCGVVYAWAAVSMLAIVGIIGLSLDVGYGMLVGSQLQNAADAASLAGVAQIYNTPEDVRQASWTIAFANKAAGSAVQLDPNYANSSGGDIVLGQYDRDTGVFTPAVDQPNAVKVVARRTGSSLGGALDLFFAPIFGVNTADVERTAIAIISGGTGAGLITLNETDKWTFQLGGNIVLNVYDESTPGGDGAIQVNSNNYYALRTDGSPTLVASAINVVADTVNDPPVFDGDVNTAQPILPDPLAELPPPVNWGMNRGTVSVNSGTHYLQPGYYPGGISMNGGTVDLAPGIYVLDGEGLKVTGGDLLGDGVMFYIVDTTPTSNPKSAVNLTGNGVIELTPIPLEQAPYGGILIWQAADNTNAANLRGTDQFDGLDGTVYLPTAHVDVTGTSDNFGIRQLISDTVSISGSGTVTINYDGRNPAPGTVGFLVR